MSFLIWYSKASITIPPCLGRRLPGVRRCATSRSGPGDCAATSSVARHHRLLRQHAKRAGRVGRQPSHRVLDDAVLQRVKRDDRQPPARLEPVGRVRDEAIEPVELAVHPDAQRLKRARRRIDPLPAPRRHRAPHDRGQFAGGRRSARAPPSRAAIAPRVPLLAELVDHVGELFLAGLRSASRPRVGPVLWSMRMSSGSSRLKLKPRPAASSCIDDTPRSASTPCDALHAAPSRTAGRSPVVGVHAARRARRTRRARPGRAGKRRAVAIEPDHAVGARVEQRRACGRRGRPCNRRTGRRAGSRAASTSRAGPAHDGFIHGPRASAWATGLKFRTPRARARRRR